MRKIFSRDIHEHLQKIGNAYNADHDLGPEAPVTWREMELMQAVSMLIQKVDDLELKVIELQGDIEGARAWQERQVQKV